MISWIITLWSWSPVATITLYFATGYFLNGFVNKFIPEEEDLFNFTVSVILWPILVPAKLIGTYVFLPCALGLSLLIMEYGPAMLRALAWANRGFRQLPQEHPRGIFP